MNKKKSNIIALAITIIFTIIVLWNVDFGELLRLCELFDKKYIIPYMVIFIFVMAGRAFRWKILLPKSGCKFIDLYEIYMTSNLLNIFLPARAGDIFRGVYFGQKYKLSKLSMLGTVLAERILDGLTVICILSFGIILYYRSKLVLNLLLLTIVLFVGSFIFMLWVYKYKKIDFVCEKVKTFSNKLPQNISEKLCLFVDKCNPLLNAFMDGFEKFTDVKGMLEVTFYGALSWAGDCFLVYFLMMAFGIETHYAVSFFVVSFIALSTVIPQSSMYIGLYQGAFILAAKLFGISKTVALSVALTQQMLIFLVYAIVALIFIWKNQLKFSDLRKNEDSNNG